jgi:hypothetical protein
MDKAIRLCLWVLIISALNFCFVYNSHCESISIEYRDNLFTISGYQVPMAEVLGRIAREVRGDIYVVNGKGVQNRINFSIKEQTASNVLRTLLRDQSYAVVYNAGKEGSVYFLEAAGGKTPLRDYREDWDGEVVSYGDTIPRELSKKEKEIRRTEDFIANLKNRIESGQSDELYSRLVKENNPETVTHDREKLEGLEKKLNELKGSI